MNNLKNYIISFSGLKLGNHEFDFQISDSFFETFEFSRTQKANLTLKVILNRAENMLNLDFNFNGSVNVSCDSCGEEFDFPLNFSESLIVKFSDQEQEDSDEVVFLPHTAYQINLAQFIYEFVNLALPMRLTHEEDKQGNPVCRVNVLDEFEEFEDQENEEIDARWEALKKLKKN